MNASKLSTAGSAKNTSEIARERLASGGISSRALVDECLARLLDPAGEGRLVFTRGYADKARQAASAVDAFRASGTILSSIAGLPVSIKDLFDVAGEVTTAGSNVLANHSAAADDSAVVSRLKRAGAVLIGRTNMSEFAFTGVGMNPHLGTPANPYNRSRRLIPGGSSSGAVVSVADGMAVAAIGTDTGGSVRIPAALCGMTGFKATQRRISLAGVFPLSKTLDSVGVIAGSVSCCAQVDAVLSGTDSSDGVAPEPAELKGRTFAIPKNYFLDDLEKHVARCFEATLGKVSQAGAEIIEITVPHVSEIAAINARGGISAPEAYAFHQRLGTEFKGYDPMVLERILRGNDISAADYLDMLAVRDSIVRDVHQARRPYELLLCPTVPIEAPEIAQLEENRDEFRRVNRLLLRNTSVVNFWDGCALSIPCHRAGEAPVGLMLIGATLQDEIVLRTGVLVEQLIAP